MKAAKIKKIKNEKNINSEGLQETYSIKNIVKIMLTLVIIFGMFYFVTYLLVKDRKLDTSEPQSVFDSSKIVVGQLLNRSEDKYYVLATKYLSKSSYIETDYSNIYMNYINKYQQKEDSIKFYYIDLNNALNKKYYSEELNITEDLSNLKLNDEVLFRIKEGKIEKTYVGKDNIIDKLSSL